MGVPRDDWIMGPDTVKINSGCNILDFVENEPLEGGGLVYDDTSGFCRGILRPFVEGVRQAFFAGAWISSTIAYTYLPRMIVDVGSGFCQDEHHGYYESVWFDDDALDESSAQGCFRKCQEFLRQRRFGWNQLGRLYLLLEQGHLVVSTKLGF